jgi:anthranilate synthase component II
VTATDAAGNVMALRHVEYDLRGVQFHPESVMTPQGKTIVENWLKGA